MKILTLLFNNVLKFFPQKKRLVGYDQHGNKYFEEPCPSKPIKFWLKASNFFLNINVYVDGGNRSRRSVKIAHSKQNVTDYMSENIPRNKLFIF